MMILNPYRYAVAGSGGALYDEIMGLSGLAMYLRLDEASGTSANNETGGTDGSYFSSPSLGNAALYTGGPVCMGTDTGNSGAALWPGTAVPALTNMSIGFVYKPSAISGTRHLVTRDRDSGGTRFWQYRLEGSNIVFYNGLAGFTSVSVAHGMSAGSSYLIGLTVSSGGQVKIYRNGSLLTTGSLTGVNYGGSDSTDIAIGNRHVASEATADFFSEVFLVAGVVTGTEWANMTAAAGL